MLAYRINDFLIKNDHKTHWQLRKKSNLAVEGETSPTVADAPSGGMHMSTTVDDNGLGSVEFVFPSDASIIPDFKRGKMIESK